MPSAVASQQEPQLLPPLCKSEPSPLHRAVRGAEKIRCICEGVVRNLGLGEMGGQQIQQSMHTGLELRWRAAGSATEQQRQGGTHPSGIGWG